MIFNIEVGMKKVTASLDSGLPADVTVTAGGQATFKVVVTDEGFPKEHTFQWFVNETAIEGATGDTYTRDTSGDRGVISVWCEVTNKAGAAVSRRATLTVNKLPVLNASYPADASVTIAKPATFSVSIAEHGYPTNYRYQWYVNNVAVEDATGSSYTHIRTREGVGTDWIYCSVMNDAGFVHSRAATYTAVQEYIVKNGAFTDDGTWGTYLSGGAGQVTQESWCLYMYCDGMREARAWSNKAYDFTGKYKLVFYCDHFDNTCSEGSHISTFHFGVCDSLNDDNFIALTAVRGHDGNNEYVTVDLSQVTGWHYIKIAINRDVYCADIVAIRDIYFE